jgi:hypothetical protein
MASSSTPSKAPATKFLLPDLVSHCTFDIHISRHRKQITAETKKWLFKGDNLQGKVRDKFHGLKAGTLSAMCYPDAGCPQLRVCNDFLTYLFHLDNLSDDMDNRSTKATADVVLNSLYHPHTWRSPARVGKMTRECVHFSHKVRHHADLSFQFLQAHGLDSLAWDTAESKSPPRRLSFKINRWIVSLSRRSISSSRVSPNKLWIATPALSLT